MGAFDSFSAGLQGKDNQSINLEGLNPDLANRIALAKEAYKSEFGKDLPITSGARSFAKQKELYERAKKGEKGIYMPVNPDLNPQEMYHTNAVDISSEVPDAFLSRFGLGRPLGSKDPVHVMVVDKGQSLPFQASQPNSDMSDFMAALQSGKLAEQPTKVQPRTYSPSSVESAIVGFGKPFYSGVAAIGQLAGKGLKGLGATETGENIYQGSTELAKRVERAAKPFEQANPNVYTGGEIAGYIFNPINKAIPGGGATSLTGSVAQGALQGAAANVLTTPVTDENKSFLTEKASQAAVGGAFGGVAGGVAKGLTSLAQPVKNQLSDISKENVEILRKAGVPVDVTQATGSTVLQRQKAALMDNPFTAGKEEVFAANQRSAFNRAIARTMGEDADAITPAVIQKAKDRLGNIYDDLLTRNNLRINRGFENELLSLKNESQRLLPEGQNAVPNIIDDILEKSRVNRGHLTGQQYQYIKRQLDALDKQGGLSSHFAGELKDSLLEGVTNTIKNFGNKADIDLLKQTNKQYGNMKKIEDVVSKNIQGDVSPSLLSNSLATKSKRHVLYQEDNELANLARAGKDILEQKLPNSGTVARFLAQNPIVAGARAIHGKVAQEIMTNPKTAQYLEQGVQPGYLRNILELPKTVGNQIPPYAAKSGVSGNMLLREFLRLRNQEQE